MYCKNCGNEVDGNAAVCLKCGFAAGTGKNYCPFCGKETNEYAAVCISCGKSLIPPRDERKSKIAAGLLGILIPIGIHSFYLGFNGKGIAQLLLSFIGVGSVWSVIEGILILTGNIDRDADGNTLKD